MNTYTLIIHIHSSYMNTFTLITHEYIYTHHTWIQTILGSQNVKYVIHKFRLIRELRHFNTKTEHENIPTCKYALYTLSPSDYDTTQYFSVLQMYLIQLSPEPISFKIFLFIFICTTHINLIRRGIYHTRLFL